MSCVRRTVVLPVPREEAWEEVAGDEWLGDPRERTVEERVEDRRLTWRWGEGEDESLVEVSLDDEPAGTRVTVIEVRTADLPEVPAAVPAELAALVPA